MDKGSKKRLSDILSKIKSEGEDELSELYNKNKQGEDELSKIYNKYKQGDYARGPIGRPRGKSTKTIQRHNWIRDMFVRLKKKRLAHTKDEFARLILSEMKENTPRFFENNIYKKSTILKVLKNKSWGDD